MAQITDYQNNSFGYFQINKNIGHGAEAEVYECVHTLTRRTYILRLDVNDDNTWENEPIIPPINITLETKNAIGTWLEAKNRHGMVITVDGTNVLFSVTALYGVLDSRYLIPIASPKRVRGCWDVDKVLNSAPPYSMFTYSPLWEMFGLEMLTAAHQMPENEWNNQWGILKGGEVIKLAISSYLENGGLSSSAKQKIIERVSTSQNNIPDLTENLLIRLVRCVFYGLMSLQEAQATLLCRHFRVNVSFMELQQFFTVFRIFSGLQNNQLTAINKNELFVLFEFMKTLSQQPLSDVSNNENFEWRDEQPDFHKFSLILQEHAAFKEPFLHFEMKTGV